MREFWEELGYIIRKGGVYKRTSHRNVRYCFSLEDARKQYRMYIQMIADGKEVPF